MSSDKENVLKYLEEAHRPYNLNDIHQNMHTERTKAAIQKALDQLVSEQKIREKVYNKQKIYSVLPKPGQNSDDIFKQMQEIESKVRIRLQTFR